MKILYINPGAAKEMYGEISAYVGVEPPYWLALWAAQHRVMGDAVHIIDAEVERLSPIDIALLARDYKPDRVIVTAMGVTPGCSSTPKMDAVIAICRHLKGIAPIGINGIHPKALPELSLKETGADYIEPHRFSFIRPAWDLLPMHRYQTHPWHSWSGDRNPYASIYTSYGCPYSCTFCAAHSFYGHRVDLPVSSVLEQLRYLNYEYGITSIKIADELFAFGEERVLEICASIRKEFSSKLNMWAYSRVDSLTPRMAEAMVNCGIKWIALGFESANQDIRKGIKKSYTHSKMLDTVRICREAGAYINADFMFGLPHDTLETMQETLGFALEIMAEYINFFCCIAYPGAKLYPPDSPLPNTWTAYSQYSPDFLPLPTDTLSGLDVRAFRDRAHIQYYSNPEYLEKIERLFGSSQYVKEFMVTPLRRIP